jgi:hypothetical protein
MTGFEVKTLKNLSHDSLVTNTKSLVQRETEITLKVLFHIQEIERRRLHIERGFSSLHEFCVKYLGYSDGSAARRIQASRLLKAHPELETKIEKGEMSLSVAAQAQNFFYSEMKVQNKIYSKEQKQEILQILESKSSREAEKELLKISPQSLPKEKLRQVTAEHKELRVILDEDLVKEFEELKSWLSHKIPNGNYQDLIREAVKIANQELRKRRLGSEKKNRNETKRLDEKPKFEREEKNQAPTAEQKPKGLVQTPKDRVQTPESQAQFQILQEQRTLSEKRTRTIPVHIKREIWRRDQGRCTFIDAKTKRKCDSKVMLEFDHFQIPFAEGGSHSAENLRLVCRQHNTQAALNRFGLRKMAQWLAIE